jgi:hypothetical protein
MIEDHPITLPPELSPAAQAVLDAYGGALLTERYTTSGRIEIAIAAALRALANHQTQIVTHGPLDRWTPAERNRRELLRIAAELDGSNTTSENVLDS